MADQKKNQNYDNCNYVTALLPLDLIVMMDCLDLRKNEMQIHLDRHLSKVVVFFPAHKYNLHEYLYSLVTLRVVKPPNLSLMCVCNLYFELHRSYSFKLFDNFSCAVAIVPY